MGWPLFSWIAWVLYRGGLGGAGQLTKWTKSEKLLIKSNENFEMKDNFTHSVELFGNFHSKW